MLKVGLNEIENGLIQLKNFIGFLWIIFKSIHSNFTKVNVISNRTKNLGGLNENSSYLRTIFK